MKDICNITKCTGCMACTNACTHGAIHITQDEEGFDRPVIDISKCVDCGLCEAVCPVNNPPVLYETQKVYSGWLKEETLRLDSSSGGAFTALAIPVLRRGGVVFGVRLNDQLQVEHCYIEKEEDLYLLRGSKYVQSKIGRTYREARDFLKAGRAVLFCGTPCQIAGLRNFLHRDYDNLLTVDLICHGVPSPKVFEDWKQWFKKTNNLKSIDGIKFRGKKSSWIFFHMVVTGHVEKGNVFRYEGKYYEDAWIRGFLRDYFLRPSCHRCRFARQERCGDFTIADWWGYKPVRGESRDFERKGVSLILCNTDRGKQYFSAYCSERMVLRERTLQEAVRTNSALSRPFESPKQRADFWVDYKIYPFDRLVKKYMLPEQLTLAQHLRYHYDNNFGRDLAVLAANKVDGALRRLHVGKRTIRADVFNGGFTNLAHRVKEKVVNLNMRSFYRRKGGQIIKDIKRFADKKKIFLFCTPTHSNLGDQAQLYCWLRLFARWYPEHRVICVPTRIRLPQTIDTIRKVLRHDDLIFIHSGYLIFDIHPELPFILDIVRSFRNHPVTILPQTVNLMYGAKREEVADIFNSHPNLTLMCRDEVSYGKAQALFPNAMLKLFPDVVTSLIGSSNFKYDGKREGVLLCVRNDLEKFYTDEDIASLRSRFGNIRVDVKDTTIKADEKQWFSRRETLIRTMISDMATYKVVITDRYHGTIFSQIAATPTVVIASTDHKLSSGVKWFPTDLFNDYICFANSLDEAYTKAAEILKRTDYKYISSSYFMDRYWQKPVITSLGGG